jgi:DNA modification methylase
MKGIICGDALSELKKLPDEFVDCCITSPPYWGLRDYGVPCQLGLEKTPEEYVAKMVEVFREVRRVLKKEGVVFLNLGDSYAGSGKGGQSDEKRSENWQPEYANKGNVPGGLKQKDLVGIPWRVAFALQADGWYLRQDIIWHKPNPMPESVTDRCTKSHEYIFLLAKSQKYYFDNEAIKERGVMESAGSSQRDTRETHGTGGGNTDINKAKERMKKELAKNGYVMRNRRSVWTITTKPFKEAHFATFPEDLIVPMVLAGCPKKGLVLDPFMGAGTTALVAKKLRRNYLGIELNPAYIKIANKRLAQEVLI